MRWKQLLTYVIGGQAVILVASAVFGTIPRDLPQGFEYGGLAYLGISAVLSGAMVSGDRIRANAALEPADERRSRLTYTLLVGITGLVSLGVGHVIRLALRP
ncbi:MAG: hypothetical protein IRZ18_03295 [Clostridia bacterium]|nr:hypothetical protein [Clostridia bacterium]